MTVAGDGGKNDAEPMQLELDADAVTDGDDQVSAGSTRWRRWGWLVAAFVLGAAASVVVIDARRDAEQRTDLNVVLGTQMLHEQSPLTLEYAVLNVGPRTVDIMHVVPTGWNRTADEERQVTAEPGVWTAVPTAVVADCAVRPDATVRVTARARAGVMSSDTMLPPELHNELLAMWAEACPARPLVEIAGGLTEVTSAEGDAMSGIVWLEPLGSEQSVRIVQVDAWNAGFLAVSPDLPVDLPTGERTAVSVEWRIIDCDQALRLTNARLEVTVATPDPRALVSVPLDDSAALALARFSGSSCRS